MLLMMTTTTNRVLQQQRRIRQILSAFKGQIFGIEYSLGD